MSDTEMAAQPNDVTEEEKVAVAPAEPSSETPGETPSDPPPEASAEAPADASVEAPKEVTPPDEAPEDTPADAAKDAGEPEEASAEAPKETEAPAEAPQDSQEEEGKRKREDEPEAAPDASEAKKPKTEEEGTAAQPTEAPAGEEPGEEVKGEGDTGEGAAAANPNEPPPIPAAKEGTSIFNDHDVLSGRGGGTNVHPGNRNFRDLINLHRRAYLKARKNDKPSISRAIVRSIRDNNGGFLKKDDKSGLWFEIGDDAAREKTSQALRQRAPEMRKLLFDTEREESRAVAEEHMRQQRMMMGMPPEMMAQMANMNNMPHPGMNMGPGGGPMFPNPAFLAQMAANNKNGVPPNGPEGYNQMFSAAMMNRGPPPQGQNGTHSKQLYWAFWGSIFNIFLIARFSPFFQDQPNSSNRNLFSNSSNRNPYSSNRNLYSNSSNRNLYSSNRNLYSNNHWNRARFRLLKVGEQNSVLGTTL
jgi:hypothetical protein